MRLSTIVLVGILFNCCQTNRLEETEITKYRNDVGDIRFDSKTDRKNFHLCDSTKMSTSRRGLSYLGGNGSVERACKKKFIYDPSFESFSGFVTIRFIINCRQESDRFRVQSMDFNFTEKECPKALIDHLVLLVSELDEWKPRTSRYEGIDFSKYLNFRIENGKITDVLQ